MNQTMTNNHNTIQQTTEHGLPIHEVYGNYEEGFDEEDYCYDGDVYDEYDFSLSSVKAIGGGNGTKNFRDSQVGDGRMKKNKNNEKDSSGGSSRSNKPTIYSQKHIRIQESMRENKRMKRKAK